jgi:hypothetical protein
LIVTVGLVGQESLPVSKVQGSLLEWEGSATAGELSIRTTTYHVYLFRFNAQTVFERASRRISILDTGRGDVLAVFSDSPPGTPGSYARKVQVLRRAAPPARNVLRPRARSRFYPRYVDRMFPRGRLTMAGVVLRRSEGSLVLRTRFDGEQTVLLRPDTRYLESGSQVASSALKVNTRIFVRGGKNLDQEIEAYQVIWGEILLPR